MNSLKLISRRVVYIVSGWGDALLGRKSRAVVLCYHSVSKDEWKYSVDPKELEWQLGYMSENYRPIELGELIVMLRRGKLPAEPVFALTFDDGYADIFRAREVCRRLGIKPTVFAVGSTEKVNRQILQTERRLLKPGELRLLAKDGWMIGSHGNTHNVLTNLDAKELRDELTVSRGKLARAVGEEVMGFSYPKGRYNNQTISQVKQAGYKWAVSMDDTYCIPGCETYALPRVGVDGSHQRSEFKYLASPTVIAARKFVKLLWPSFEI